MPTVVEFYISDKDRKSCTKHFTAFFDKHICTEIERGIYDYTKQYCKCSNINLTLAQSVYNHTLENILFNLESNNHTIKKLKSLIKKEKYNPYNLAFLSPDELNEDNWYKIIMRKTTSEDKLKNLPTMEWKPCRDCKNIEYSYYQQQTRSADEPMTTFYICRQCGKTYKVNN